MSLFSCFKKVVKKELVKNAELKINNAVYVPVHETLFPNYIAGEFKTTYVPAICEIIVEYENEEYILKDEVKFYLEFLKDVDFPNDKVFVKHDILIKEYKNGKREIELYGGDNKNGN